MCTGAWTSQDKRDTRCNISDFINFWYTKELISILLTTPECKCSIILVFLIILSSVGAAISVESQDIPDVLSKLL